jgi:hypothetical protein
MPDFDERQGGTYNWIDPIWQIWSHCAPVSVANSLWWLDSEFESGSIPPPTSSDHFKLVTSYNATWDDHDPRNVPYLVEHLAYLMDTDGRRTFPATGISHTGTNVTDMETGLAQYLQWSGVNPIGDVNGDGAVNATDYNIVVAANNTTPLSPSWSMAADIYPVVLGRLADNVVNQSDIDLVTAHLNEKGMFCERTIPAPDFDLIEKEVEKCEDVVLTIGFWTFTGNGWTRENYPYEYPNTGQYGHALTVAGVNSTTLKIAISDPAFDNFESGGEGRSPVPHVHFPPEPPYTTHNDASLVSQDMYNVTQVPLAPPCPGGNWTIVGYDGCGPWPPVVGQVYAIIENAIVTSPIGRDVAVIDARPSNKTIAGQKYNCWINATVANLGNNPETFNVTFYANTTALGNLTVTNLPNGTSTRIIFTWNTTGYAYSRYTIHVYAWPVPGDTNITNNNFNDSWIIVTNPGDLNGDFNVTLADLVILAQAYGSVPGDPNWNPNADIDGNGTVGLSDLVIMAQHYGQYYP